MSIAGSSYLTLKELDQSYRGTLLFTFTLSSGTVLYLCRAYDGITTGLTYGGTQYVSAVSDGRLGQLQSGSTLGIAMFGSISLDLADASATWWNVEFAQGFQGATLTAKFLFWDANTNTFSSDSRLIFQGMCDAAVRNGELLTINATSSYALAKVNSPPFPIQRTCPNNFPATASQRNDALNNPLSIYYDCGYSRGEGGPGNADANGGYYTQCNYTKSDCQLRGMYSTDANGNGTYAFGGSQWQPPATWKGKNYTSGNTTQGINTENLPKYSRYAPLTYGHTWVNGISMNVVGDPNSTRMEVVVCYGDFSSYGGGEGGVSLMLVNGLLVPYYTLTTDLLFRWYPLTTGNRNGAINTGAIYDGNGDPYGSLYVVNPIVYDQVQASNSAPSVQILLGPRAIPVYSAPGSYTFSSTDLVGWVAYDFIRYAKPDLYNNVDINSLIAYSNFCGGTVHYVAADGTLGTHRRFGVALSVEQPSSIAAILEGLKMSGRLMIVPDTTGNGVRFVGKQTLADQQPSPIGGSNNNTPLASYRTSDHPYASPTGTGYLAYDFDDSNVILGSVKIAQDPIANTPTVLSATIQDEDNQYTPDTVKLANVDLYTTIQQNNQAVIGAIGLPNYDQAYRVLSTREAELCRGNLRSDTSGTIRFVFDTSFKATHLNLGDIIRFSNTQLGIGQQLCRIEGIAPTLEYQTVTITARWHDDRWYTDEYGQPGAPILLTVAATPVSNSQINLGWFTLPYGSVTYAVYMSASEGFVVGPDTLVASGLTANSYSVTGLAEATAYFFRIVATWPGNSALSNQALGVTLVRPVSVPTGLSLNVISSSEIDLTWSLSTGGGTIYYNVWYGTNGAAGQILTTNLTSGSYKATGLFSSTAYTFAVTATNRTNQSAQSTPATASTSASSVSAASGLTATAVSAGQINLSWAASPTTGAEYIVYMSANNFTYTYKIINPQYATSLAVSSNLTAVAAGTEYWFYVVATVGGQLSAPSNSANATTSQLPTTAPTGLSATAASANQVNLSWSAVSGSGITYDVHYSSNSSQGYYGTWVAYQGGLSGTSASVTGLAPSTQYWFYVDANSPSTGTSAASAVATATTSAATVPAQAIGSFTFDWVPLSSQYQDPETQLCHIKWSSTNMVTPQLWFGQYGSGYLAATTGVGDNYFQRSLLDPIAIGYVVILYDAGTGQVVASGNVSANVPGT